MKSIVVFACLWRAGASDKRRRGGVVWSRARPPIYGAMEGGKVPVSMGKGCGGGGGPVVVVSDDRCEWGRWWWCKRKPSGGCDVDGTLII